MEVLQLIAEGKANKKTADKLGIGIKTVEKHREYPFSQETVSRRIGTRCLCRIGKSALRKML